MSLCLGRQAPELWLQPEALRAQTRHEGAVLMGQQLWRIGIIGTPLGEMGNNTGTLEQLWAEFGDRQGKGVGRTLERGK